MTGQGSHAVVLREPSTDPERVIAILADVAGISPEEARRRVLPGPQDVPGRQDLPGPWDAVAADLSARIYGPGRVLAGGLDADAAGTVAAALNGPWAHVEVVDAANPGAAPAVQRRRSWSAYPGRGTPGWPSLIVLALALIAATVGAVRHDAGQAWPVLLGWAVWGLRVRARLRAGVRDNPGASRPADGLQ